MVQIISAFGLFDRNSWPFLTKRWHPFGKRFCSWNNSMMINCKFEDYHLSVFKKIMVVRRVIRLRWLKRWNKVFSVWDYNRSATKNRTNFIYSQIWARKDSETVFEKLLFKDSSYFIVFANILLEKDTSKQRSSKCNFANLC